MRHGQSSRRSARPSDARRRAHAVAFGDGPNDVSVFRLAGHAVAMADAIPASCRICQTVDAAIGWPSLMSPPCTRRWPGWDCPWRCGITSFRIALLPLTAVRAPSARIVPFTCDQPPVPGQQRRRGHGEHLSPAIPGDQPGQRREPQPVVRLIAARLPPQGRADPRPRQPAEDLVVSYSCRGQAGDRGLC